MEQFGQFFCSFEGCVKILKKEYCLINIVVIFQDSKSEDSMSSNPARPYPAFSPLPPLQLDEPIFPPDKKSCPDLAGTFEWDSMLNDPCFSAASVSCFQHVSLSTRVLKRNP